MDSDGEIVNSSFSSGSSSPSHTFEEATLPYDENDNIGIGGKSLLMRGNGNTSTSATSGSNVNMDTSIRKRAISRHSGSGGDAPISSHKRFSVGAGADEEDDTYYQTAEGDRESTPTLTSLTSGPPHLTRSNSLGLGFDTGNTVRNSTSSSSLKTRSGSSTNQQPVMYIASSSSAAPFPASSASHHQQTSLHDDLVNIEKSPTHSTGSSAHLEEEDDRIFNEAKRVSSGST